jgi:hypothetical protein
MPQSVSRHQATPCSRGALEGRWRKIELKEVITDFLLTTMPQGITIWGRRRRLRAAAKTHNLFIMLNMPCVC